MVAAILRGKDDIKCWMVDYFDTCLRGISYDEQQRRIRDQLTHVERMLQEARNMNPSWLLMCGHYPIYSRGQHGDTDELITYLQPLLEKYEVRAYFAGHDHISEHLRYDDCRFEVCYNA